MKILRGHGKLGRGHLLDGHGLSGGLALGPNLWDPNTADIQNFGGSNGTWTVATLTVQNTATGTNATYPRLRTPVSTLTPGKTYYTSLTFTGSPTFVGLFDAGDDLAVNSNSVSGLQVADNDRMELKFNATLGAFTISDIVIELREVL